MLRITVHETPRALTFELDGRLVADSLRQLEICWRTTVTNPPRPVLRVDLTGVTFIDAAGKAHLLSMRRDGARFIAVDCLMDAVCAELTGAAEVQP